MRSIFLILIFLFFSNVSFAQNLSLKELLKFQKSTLAEINQNLTRKGWTFKSVEKPDDTKMGKAVWAFNPVGEDGATAWCILYYSEKTPNRILYNIMDNPSFGKLQIKVINRASQILNDGKQAELDSYVHSFTDYQSDTYAFRLFQYTHPNYVGIKVFTLADYQKSR